jgi:hypothetical protein
MALKSAGLCSSSNSVFIECPACHITPRLSRNSSKEEWHSRPQAYKALSVRGCVAAKRCPPVNAKMMDQPVRIAV